MPEKNKPRPRRTNRRQQSADRPNADESRMSMAVTVAWTVSVTTVLMCNLAAAGAHFIAGRQPQATGIAVLSQWLLLSGGLIGVVSLALLPVVYRVRRQPPPTPVVAFAIFAAMAPILAIAVKIAQQS